MELRNPRTVGRRAFTLVELLAVIAIVAVLAAILIPVVSKIRESANTSHCANSLRSLGQAVMLFAGEHQGYLPIANSAGTETVPGDPSTRYGHWYVQIAPYIGVEFQGDETSSARSTTKIGRPIGCPSAPKYYAGQDLQAIGVSYGWSDPPYSPNLPQISKGIPVSLIPNPARTIMLGERVGMNSAGGRNTNSDVKPPWVQTPIVPQGEEGTTTPGALRLSHNGRSNYAFFDGHVELLLPEETYSGDGSSETAPNLWKGL